MSHWPDGLSVVQVRIARPTDRLDEVVAFYRDALGLEQLGSFEHHAVVAGVMLGLPGREYHLEFTRRAGGGPVPAPSKDNLLVLYVKDREAMNEAAERLQARGHHPVPPENPYWAERGLTFEDPDGWRVVLMNTAGLGGG